MPVRRSLLPSHCCGACLREGTIPQCAYHTRSALASRDHQGHPLLWGTAWEGVPRIPHDNSQHHPSARAQSTVPTATPSMGSSQAKKKKKFWAAVYGGSASEFNQASDLTPVTWSLRAQNSEHRGLEDWLPAEVLHLSRRTEQEAPLLECSSTSLWGDHWAAPQLPLLSGVPTRLLQQQGMLQRQHYSHGQHQK